MNDKPHTPVLRRQIGEAPPYPDPASFSGVEKQRFVSYYQLIDATNRMEGQYLIADTGKAEQIAEMFHEDGVYDRAKGIHYGRDGIAHFFGAERPLVGTHHIKDMLLQEGIRIGPKSRLPATLDINESECQTLTVHGHFSGTLCESHDAGSKRLIIRKSPAELDFDDYWVLKDGKAFYRQSDIYPAKTRETTTPGRY
ncbi:MAG: nuclear transport factor 2 family protein [Rickettsiales bacterium]|nr:nuclear transport factor 2 family protein [Rickettsiales bacterium]